MKNTAIIWRARPLPAPWIFHVCWDGSVPFDFISPGNNGEHRDPTKIKQVRASGLLVVRQQVLRRYGGDYHDLGRITDRRSYCHPDECNTAT